MDQFTQAYLECALWASLDDNGESLDVHDITDIAPPTLAEMVADCKAFQESHYDDMSDDLERAGHDFWLTRNGHGAGFWDGDWPDDVGNRLTEASKVYGEYDLYFDETDSKIHSMSESIHILLSPDNFPLDKGGK
ncbi:hypothetical protein LCGC14_2702340 [marine sediment metagenome]|uniref:Uncharacterized protein n=1 Tax=marine sediment metagenome TaxID=412755 RepID=A0A0F9C7A7_9ZZZZ